MFDVKRVTEGCIQWIREWFDKNSNYGKAIVGISGGVDSSVVAALCVKALGKDRVYGVLMPQNTSDINYAQKLCDHLGIDSCVIDIGSTVNSLLNLIYFRGKDVKISRQTEINLPARIRMATLYAVSQSMNGRVANTCNLSEDWLGYNTRYGDSVGDFAPLSCFTKTEVRAIAKYLGLPKELVEAIPADGLCGMTDEERFGFTYDILDEYIRTGRCEDKRIKDAIDHLHEKNKFKMEPMARFGIEPVIKEKELYKLSYDDIVEVSRTEMYPERTLRTSVKFKDGTTTSVILKDGDEEDREKAIMWCLLKKNFKSKTGLEKILYTEVK